MTLSRDQFDDGSLSSDGDLWSASSGSPRVTVASQEWLVVSYEWVTDETSPVASSGVVLDLCVLVPGASHLKTVRVKRGSLIESIIAQIDSQVTRDLQVASQQ
ncbi:MAG: hypothetical protein IH933_04790 [Euryarchaeota archaeon]|nr:hypothetical protein [Euryarchaeota archaeon]